jgi:predicted metallopeptidase
MYKILKELVYNRPKKKRLKKKRMGVDWQDDPQIRTRVNKIISDLDLSWIEPNNLTCYSSTGSSTRAYARIWGLSKVWQMALNVKPHYIIEVISEKFNRLGKKEQNEVLIHELMHIPKNFSGALMPHIKKRGKRNFHDKVKSYVNKLNS